MAYNVRAKKMADAYTNRLHAGWARRGQHAGANDLPVKRGAEFPVML